jgi:hypothetical protein
LDLKHIVDELSPERTVGDRLGGQIWDFLHSRLLGWDGIQVKGNWNEIENRKIITIY